MLKLLATLSSTVLLTQCAAEPKPTKQPKKPIKNSYNQQLVIKKEFPFLAVNRNLKKVTMEQLFATLPYFKGRTYQERLKIVSQGLPISGSLKDNYNESKPHKFLFKKNGFGQQVAIKTIDEGDVSDYLIEIKDIASGKIILSKMIVYGTFDEANQLEFKTHRWIF